MGRDRRELPEQARQFAAANDFTAKPGKCLTLPAPDGKIAQVVFGLEDESSKSRDLFRPGALPGLLPPGVYRFANAPHDVRLATLAFALGTYRFGRYRKNDRPTSGWCRPTASMSPMSRGWRRRQRLRAT
jgi:Leucyl aminopeptidase